MAFHRSIVVSVFALALGACADDPRYIQPLQLIEVGIPGSDITFATAQVILPVRPETPEEAQERGLLSAELGGIQVPYVRRDDLSVSIEWAVRNVSNVDGTARVHINGGNEWFYYVPINFVFDPDEDEEPPPLAGDIPFPVPAGLTVSGVFREDELREAAVDLELITRAATNPFAAMLQDHGDLTEFIDPATGATIPAEAFAHLIQFDIGLEADRQMVLEYAVRVRDHRGLLHDFLLDAPAGELTAFAPVEFVPPPPP